MVIIHYIIIIIYYTMSNIISSIVSKWVEKAKESLPKVWSAIGDTFSKFKEIGSTWRQKTIGERAKTYYGKWREETKSDFTYFNMSSLKEAFKTIWTKPKALLWDPLKWLTVGTAMTLWWAAVSVIPNTAIATWKGVVNAGTWVLWTWARIMEWWVTVWGAMMGEWVSKFADKLDLTSPW
jgi:ABC-type multidrug transport system fused ATPase/permease subunit